MCSQDGRIEGGLGKEYEDGPDGQIDLLPCQGGQAVQAILGIWRDLASEVIIIEVMTKGEESAQDEGQDHGPLGLHNQPLRQHVCDYLGRT